MTTTTAHITPKEEIEALAARQTPQLVIRWFEELSLYDVESVGGKGANLGELSRLGVPVSPGFVITADAFCFFLEEAGLRQQVLSRLVALDVDDTAALKQASVELQEAVLNAACPTSIRQAILNAHTELGRRCSSSSSSGCGAPEEPYVAVRSSATAEDMPGTSFAGMNETFLDVRGEEALLEAVRGCWASLYGARVLFYRRKQNIPEEKIAIAVIVQRMVDSEAAGVMFTANPASGDRNTLVIEGAFGLGDTVVSGAVSPDRWDVNKDTLRITNERISPKHVATFRDAEGRHQTRDVSPEQALHPCLDTEQVKALAALGIRVEKHYNAPQDIEWALAGDYFYLVQTRPITTLVNGADHPSSAERFATPEVLVRGLGASPGVRCGTARVIESPEESERLMRGDVLVAPKTEPDWTPLMKRAAAIVTDEGGMTAHAAIVARELGIPCIVGTQDGTRRIADGMEITVDAGQGVVYRGRVEEKAKAAAVATAREPSIYAGSPVTATRLYVNLGQVERVEEIAAQDVDGVGLLRIEFLVMSVTGNTHPRRMLADGRGDEFRDGLADGLARFARAFAPRPVVARTTDFRTNEYRNMTGGAQFEPEEANPMIGYRGVFRYIKEPDLFRLELEAFRKVREEQGLKNLIPMLPFVRTLSELKTCRRLMDEVGLTADDPAFPLWIMAEVPSVVYRLPEYVREAGVTGVSIGSNDLTQLMLGIDRDSETLAPLFDERDPAVLSAIEDIIGECRRLGVTCSICGQAPSVYPEIAEKLVAWGIDSISVNPDVIDRTRRIIASAEQRVLLDGLR